MKVTIDFDETTIQPLLQKHLETGEKVADMIEASVILLSKLDKRLAACNKGVSGDEKFCLAIIHPKYKSGYGAIEVVNLNEL